MRSAADHDGELRLVVDVLGVGGRDNDLLPAADQRVGELRKPHRRLGYLLPGLGCVVAVVETEADDLLRIGQRRTQPYFSECDPLAHGFGAFADPREPVRVEHREEPTHGVGRHLQPLQRDDRVIEEHAGAGAGGVLIAEQAHVQFVSCSASMQGMMTD